MALTLALAVALTLTLTLTLIKRVARSLEGGEHDRARATGGYKERPTGLVWSFVIMRTPASPWVKS